MVIKTILNGGVVPEYKTEGSAGADLSASLDGSVTVAPGEQALIPIGINIKIPEGYTGLVFSRSGHGANYGVTLANSVGVIDSDYRGELKCPVINHGKEPFAITDGMRIAQLVIVPFCKADFVQTDALTETKRGMSGFGSTG